MSWVHQFQHEFQSMSIPGNVSPRIVKKVCGKVPVWPETLRMARTSTVTTHRNLCHGNPFPPVGFPGICSMVLEGPTPWWMGSPNDDPNGRAYLDGLKPLSASVHILNSPWILIQFHSSHTKETVLMKESILNRIKPSPHCMEHVFSLPIWID